MAARERTPSLDRRQLAIDRRSMAGVLCMGPAKDAPVWEEAFAATAASYLQRYFGGFGGLTTAFPCMRDDYPWAANRPDVPDSRVPAKNNTEYHGLESLAGQYHSAAMYQEASHHWLMAAWCRRIDKTTHGFNDAGHDRALSFCLKNAKFNDALKDWSDNGGRGPAPEPSEFGLTDQQADRIEAEGAQILEEAYRSTQNGDAR